MTTFDKVKEILVEQLRLDEAEVNMDSKIMNDLGADSLDTMELIMAFEEEFGIDIPDCEEDICNKTVRDAVEYIDKAKAE